MTRWVVAALAAAVLCVAAGCGGSGGGGVAQGGSSTTAGTNDPVAFASCMRAHGVPRFPDPGSDGTIPKESLAQLGVSSARFQAAQAACRHLLPNGGRPPDQAEQQRVAAEGLRFARCVRAHGVPGFPDPGSDGRIPDPASVGIDQASPKFEAANRACAQERPPYMPSNSAYESWARTHRG